MYVNTWDFYILGAKMTQLQKHITYETQKSMLIKLYKSKLISFEEFLSSLTSLMKKYNLPHVE